MKKTASFQELYQEAEQHEDFWVAGAVQGFTEELVRVMDEQGITRAELARRLDSSPAYVTKILRGDANFTLASMIKLSRALNTELQFQLAQVPGSTKETKPSKARRGGRNSSSAEKWAAVRLGEAGSVINSF